MAPRARPLLDRVLDKIDTSGDCWLWLAAVSTEGYAVVKVSRSAGQALVHRLMYEWFVGPIDKPHLDHLCRTRRCVRPTHLEPVTPRENTRRGTSDVARRMDQVECDRGHRNWRITPSTGKRYCRSCLTDRQRERRAIRSA